MKPFELTIYPKLERPRTGDEILPYQKARRREMNLAESKRLTPAELAAEYWFDYSIYVRESAHLLSCHERYMEAAAASFGDAERKCRILHRFAILPHYDEESA